MKDSPPPPGQRVSSANPDALSTRCPAPCGRGPQGALAWPAFQRPRRKGKRPASPPARSSPGPTSVAGLSSAELCWGADSRDRRVPSSDTWDFSVSLSMPRGWGAVRTPAPASLLEHLCTAPPHESPASLHFRDAVSDSPPCPARRPGPPTQPALPGSPNTSTPTLAVTFHSPCQPSAPDLG